MIGVLYLALSTSGYFLLGDCLEYNVLDSLSEGPLKTAAQTLLMLHLIVAFPLLINAPNQYLEQFLHIPQGALRDRTDRIDILRQSFTFHLGGRLCSMSIYISICVKGVISL